jgi:hypothetical protein
MCLDCQEYTIKKKSWINQDKNKIRTMKTYTKPGQSRHIQNQENQDTYKTRKIKAHTKPEQSRHIQSQENQGTYTTRTIKTHTKYVS